MSSLVVNTNIAAIDAYNNLNATDTAMSKAISQLSSGLQIQSAADNPAGYVVSQDLLSQSNGYQQAVSNAQNGVSMIQTANGALNQISSLLQTMDSLAINSSNGATNSSQSLSANQQEFAALQNQIDQIANTTSFGSTEPVGRLVLGSGAAGRRLRQHEPAADDHHSGRHLGVPGCVHDVDLGR